MAISNCCCATVLADLGFPDFIDQCAMLYRCAVHPVNRVWCSTANRKYGGLVWVTGPGSGVTRAVRRRRPVRRHQLPPGAVRHAPPANQPRSPRCPAAPPGNPPPSVRPAMPAPRPHGQSEPPPPPQSLRHHQDDLPGPAVPIRVCTCTHGFRPPGNRKQPASIDPMKEGTPRCDITDKGRKRDPVGSLFGYAQSPETPIRDHLQRSTTLFR